MSIYYYFYADKQKECWELTSGSWGYFMRQLYDILTTCTQEKKSFKFFVEKLQKRKVFDDFYDDGEEFITPENVKYCLQPLYDWAFDKKIQLLDDNELCDIDIRLLCEQNHIKYEVNEYGEYSDEVEHLIDKAGRDEELLCITCVGKFLYDEQTMAQIGVGFERAVAELKSGATIWRKGTDVSFRLNNDLIVKYLGFLDGTYTSTGKCETFTVEEVLADDWLYGKY